MGQGRGTKCRAVGWDQIRGTRLRVGESKMVGRRSLRDLVPPYGYGFPDAPLRSRGGQ